MSNEEISEVIELCQEIITSLSTLPFKYESKPLTYQGFNLNNLNQKAELSIEAFLGELDLELIELKKMVEEYDKIESEELSVEDIEKKIKNLKQKVEQESKKST
ncbi:MAG: hypothetical protein QXS21_01790 [Thermoproteota archaeon]|nr:hypothetical protein [Candidatus Brockarchaeota archaeon]MBO3768371.1 hypothetical protein [Candidatus Brockarchaeota archaeon]MBO3800773.1 hypothetical protein [Candidatus Brockarchaeota archaeon]